MEVSNSTGTKSEFRVTGTGGSTEPEMLWTGFLGPGERDASRLEGWTSERKCWVQFFIDGVEVASATFHTLPNVVILRESAWGHHAEPEQPEYPEYAVAGRDRCFPASTRVAVLGGAERRICELRPGNLVYSWDGRRGALTQGLITRVITGTATRLIRVNGSLMASPEHRILTSRGYVEFDEIRVGDRLIRFPGAESQEVCSLEVLLGETPVYNLEVAPYASFFAEGLAVEDFTGEDSVELHETADALAAR